MLLSLVPHCLSEWKRRAAVQTVVGRRKASRSGLDSATAGPMEGPLAEEASWARTIRHSCRAGDFAKVACSVLAMGGGNQADEMQCLLSEEAMRMRVGSYAAMLHVFEEHDVPPHHAVQIWRMTEAWFRRQAPSIEKWTSILQALVVAGNVEEAFEQLRIMETGEDIRLPMPNTVTYSLFMPVLAERYGLASANSLTSRMSLRGEAPTPVSMLIMSVANARASPPNLDVAKLWLRKAEQRPLQDVPMEVQLYCYNTLMSGYFRAGMLKDGFSILGCMRVRCVQPSGTTFQILMHACMEQSANGIEECRQLLRVMQQMDVEPSTAHYNVLIKGYGRSGQLTSALKVANRMREGGIAWDFYTYLFLIDAVVKAGQVEMSLRLLSKMRQDGVRPHDAHYILAFVGLAQAGFYEDACRVFRRLELIPNLASQDSYNMMIAVNCMRGDMPGAADVQQRMEKRGFPSDIQTYRTILQGYKAQGELDSMIEMQEQVLALLHQLKMLQSDTGATPAARAQATVLLERRDWNWTFDILIEAAIQKGEWNRAVALLEVAMEEGLWDHPGKHAKLLQDAKPSFRIKQHLAPEESMDRRPKKDDWIERLPQIVQSGAGFRNRVKKGSARFRNRMRKVPAVDNTEGLVPAHVFCASFNPDWLDSTESSSSSSSGSGSSRDSHTDDLNVGDSSGTARSQAKPFRRIHDYHHATAHRRPIASLSLSPGRTVICRTVPETASSLLQLFDTFGTPGMPRSPVYIFLRPVVAELDALLMLLSFGASHPKDVILLRSEENEGINSLSDECRARGDQPLSHSIASTLNNLPLGLVLNSTAFIASGTDLVNATPFDFETTIGAMIPESDGLGAGLSAKAAADDSVVTSWPDWLKQQQLRHLVRCEKGTVRLDAVAHPPAMSSHDVVRARVLDDGKVAVDLWLTNECGVAEFD